MGRTRPVDLMDDFVPGWTVAEEPFDELQTGKQIGELAKQAVVGFPDGLSEDGELLSTDLEGVFVLEWTSHETQTTLNSIPPTGSR